MVVTCLDGWEQDESGPIGKAASAAVFMDHVRKLRERLREYREAEIKREVARTMASVHSEMAAIRRRSQ